MFVITRSGAVPASARFRVALIVACALGTAGCYTYVPVDFTQPQQGRSIRADLTPEGERQVIPRFGPGVREVRGITLANDGTGLSVLVDAVQGRQGMMPLEAEPIVISPEHVAAVYERRLSRARSALFVGGLLTAAVLMVERFATGGRHLDEDEDDDPGPVQSRVPRMGVSIPIGW